VTGLVKTGLASVTGGTSVWLPWAIAGLIIAGLGGAVWVQTSRLHAAETETTSAKHDLGIAQSDVTRWTAHSSEQDAEIASLNKQLAQRVADAAAADQAAQANADAQAAAVANLQIQLKRLKEQAHAHPDQVRPLGPIVLDVLRSGQAGTTPAAPGRH